MEGVITLNVGGVLYTTSRSTLTRDPNSMLGAMFSGQLPTAKDKDGNYFIDRDGQLFRFVLNFLRDNKLVVPDGFTEFESLKAEAVFYQIKGLEGALITMSNKKRSVNHDVTSSPSAIPERDNVTVCKLLIEQGSNDTSLRLIIYSPVEGVGFRKLKDEIERDLFALKESAELGFALPLGDHMLPGYDRFRAGYLVDIDDTEEAGPYEMVVSQLLRLGAKPVALPEHKLEGQRDYSFWEIRH